MAHAVETMAYAGELPWHGLGVKVADDLTPREMQEAAGLDWSVEKLPMVAKAGNEEIRIPTQQALVRSTDKKVLSVIGQNWEPVQNDEAFDFFVDFVKQGNMQMHTAGSLQDGKMVWALAKVDDDFELFNGDKVESYLLFSNPHQYGIYLDSIKGNISIKPETLRKQFMLEAFRHTAEYDATISSWMEDRLV